MKNNEDLISIILPVYKVEKYLDKCMETIVNQTYKNLEIILVDDGSPDNCPQMCDEWAQKDKRIKVIHKQNGGLSDARNAGLEVFRGQYVMFVDSDDYLDLNLCDVLYNSLKEHNCDFAMGNVTQVDENYNVIKTGLNREAVFYKDDVVQQIYENKISYIATAWAKLFKSNIFKNIRFKVGKLHEDEYCFNELIFKTKKFSIVNKASYYYLQRKSSIVNNKTIKNIEDILQAYEERIDILNTKFPENKEKNSKLYLFLLRNLYIISIKESKLLKKLIIKKYKTIYKTSLSKNIKDKIFRYARFLYVIASKIKHQRS